MRRKLATLAGARLLAAIPAAWLLASAGCGSPADLAQQKTFRSALTGEVCEPDQATFIAKDAAQKPVKQDGLPKNPTGIPGDNMDDASSGHTDCLGDGNSGAGDDKKHHCVFPQPGCDADGCCEEDDDNGTDDGSGATDPEPEPEPEPTPEPEPDPGTDSGSDSEM